METNFLSEDVFLHVVSFVHPYDIIDILCTCKMWNHTIQQSWEQLYISYFVSHEEARQFQKVSTQDFHKLFLFRCRLLYRLDPLVPSRILASYQFNAQKTNKKMDFHNITTNITTLLLRNDYASKMRPFLRQGYEKCNIQGYFLKADEYSMTLKQHIFVNQLECDDSFDNQSVLAEIVWFVTPFTYITIRTLNIKDYELNEEEIVMRINNELVYERGYGENKCIFDSETNAHFTHCDIDPLSALSLICYALLYWPVESDLEKQATKIQTILERFQKIEQPIKKRKI